MRLIYNCFAVGNWAKCDSPMWLIVRCRLQDASCWSSFCRMGLLTLGADSVRLWSNLWGKNKSSAQSILSLTWRAVAITRLNLYIWILEGVVLRMPLPCLFSLMLPQGTVGGALAPLRPPSPDSLIDTDQIHACYSFYLSCTHPGHTLVQWAWGFQTLEDLHRRILLVDSGSSGCRSVTSSWNYDCHTCHYSRLLLSNFQTKRVLNIITV